MGPSFSSYFLLSFLHPFREKKKIISVFYSPAFPGIKDVSVAELFTYNDLRQKFAYTAG